MEDAATASYRGWPDEARDLPVARHRSTSRGDLITQSLTGKLPLTIFSESVNARRPE
jgi:hypothetical protein